MKPIKQMGIWMNHSNAYLMELSHEAIIENCIVSEFTQEEKEMSLCKNEKFMHNKEQHFLLSFYKKISEIIKSCQEVVIFGPTEAKSELFNLMQEDHLFENIKIEVKNADKMSANQMHLFVRDYFKKP